MVASDRPVTVCVRVRPAPEAHGPALCVRVKSPSALVWKAEEKPDIAPEPLHYDRVFGSGSNQKELFEFVAQPMIEAALNGISCSIMAYGQTGSGKTYSMQGLPTPTQDVDPIFHTKNDLEAYNHRGIIPRVIEGLFNQIRAGLTVDFDIRLSHIEIYCEKIQDLLVARDIGRKTAQPQPKSSLRIYEDRSRGLFITNATEVVVRSQEEAMAVFERGLKARKTAATNMNRDSSRSHAVLLLTISRYDLRKEGGGLSSSKHSQFYLVDLAGSEKVRRTGAAGQRLSEAQAINKSLLTLSLCIAQLAAKAPHVCYRSAKLTRLLQNSLGGSSKTAIVVAVSPAMLDANETRTALRFGTRAMCMENRPTVNEALGVGELLKILVGLKDQIRSLGFECKLRQARGWAAKIGEVRRRLLRPSCVEAAVGGRLAIMVHQHTESGDEMKEEEMKEERSALTGAGVLAQLTGAGAEFAEVMQMGREVDDVEGGEAGAYASEDGEGSGHEADKAEASKAVRLCIRIRPMLANNSTMVSAVGGSCGSSCTSCIDHGETAVTSADEMRIRVVPGADTHGTHHQAQELAPAFRFRTDTCLGASSSQQEVFVEVGKPLVARVIEGGQDASVIAYGQTGSGKTYTMFEDEGADEGESGAGGDERGAGGDKARCRKAGGGCGTDRGLAARMVDRMFSEATRVGQSESTKVGGGAEEQEGGGHEEGEHEEEHEETNEEDETGEETRAVGLDDGMGADMVQTVSFCFRVSMVEVYNETVLDLLLPRPDPRNPAVANMPLQLRRQARLRACDASSAQEDESFSDDLFSEGSRSSLEPEWEWTSGAAEVPVDSPAMALHLLQDGLGRRVTAETLMNRCSSRGHVIFTIIATKYLHHQHRCQRANDSDRGDSFGTQNFYDGSSDSTSDSNGNRGVAVGEASLRLVDLAGSERTRRTQSVGERLKEAQAINKSLCALKGVIEALATNAEAKRKQNLQAKKVLAEGCKPRKKQAGLLRMHVPYRDSKLTMLLRGGLGGDGVNNTTIASASSIAAGAGSASNGNSAAAPSSSMCLLLTVSACHADASETLSTLRFGECANKLTAPPNANKSNVLSAAVVRSLIQQSKVQLMRQRRRLAKVSSLLRRAHADTTMVVQGLRWASCSLLEAERGYGAHHVALARVSVYFRPSVLQRDDRLLEIAPGGRGDENSNNYKFEGGGCVGNHEAATAAVMRGFDEGGRLRCLFDELGLADDETSTASSTTASIKQWLQQQAAAIENAATTNQTPTNQTPSTSSNTSGSSSSTSTISSGGASMTKYVYTSSRIARNIAMLPERLLQQHLSAYMLPADISVLTCCSKSLLHGAMGSSSLWKRVFTRRFILRVCPSIASSSTATATNTTTAATAAASRNSTTSTDGGSSSSYGSGSGSSDDSGNAAATVTAAEPLQTLVLAELLWPLPAAVRMNVLGLAGISIAHSCQHHLICNAVGATSKPVPPPLPPAAVGGGTTRAALLGRCQCQCWIRLEPSTQPSHECRSLYRRWFAEARFLEWERVLAKWREARAGVLPSAVTPTSGVRLYRHT
jgi:hypothetical protein